MRRLTGFVHLVDDDGVLRSFGPNDHVPAWAEAKITNPKAWDGEGDDVAVHVPDITSAGSSGDGETPSAPPAAEPPGDTKTAPPSDGPPPQVGKGSGTDAWIAYARSKGFEVADDVRKKDVIAGLTDAGIPVK